MSSENISSAEAPARKIETVRVEDEMEQSYIDYAMSVIAGRSLPDVRDGLKPVQRRILYAMYEDGVTPRTSHRKSASVVGDTMGNYHPHGDSATYNALARMSQDFSLRHPLVDGQGNFGSIDDDPPAAMRYTEARLSELGEVLLDDIDSDTVDFQPNYDDRLEEPEVLPAKFPNLLVNGGSGIAVGLSTNIPPHNLGEVVDATKYLIENPDASTEELMEHLPGPDFPTGATIAGRSGIYDAYDTGKGQITVRADYTVNSHDKKNDEIVITEIPYQANKSRLVERIANMVNDGDLDGVTDLRDESDRNGVRVVVEVSQNAVTDVVENQLVDTLLEKTISIQMLALVDGQPRVLTLSDALEEYIDHRREVVRRRCENELDDKQDRAHILEGRLKALDIAEEIVDVVQSAETRDAAQEAIIESFDFTQEQAAHIVRMQLGSLTSLEADEIRTEYENVTDRISRLEEILNNESELLKVIKDELEEVKDEYADERRTDIVEGTGDVTREDLIPERQIVSVLTQDGYLKQMETDPLRSQKRGGKGVIGTGLNESDKVFNVSTASSHDVLYVFSDSGNVYEIKGYEIPEFGRMAKGTPAVNILGLDSDEQITYIQPVQEQDNDKQLVLLTEDGNIKRTGLSEFENIFSTGIRAITLDDSDTVTDATIIDGDEDIIVGTSDGRAIRFPASDVSESGRTSQGVNAVELTDEQHVTGLATVSDDSETILTVTENGFAKRSEADEYTQQSRYGKGLKDIVTDERNGNAHSVHTVADDDDIIVMTEQGNILRTYGEDVTPVGRNTKGVTLMELENDDKVADVTVLRNSSTENPE